MFYYYSENKWSELSTRALTNLFLTWLKNKYFYSEIYKSFQPRRIEDVLILLQNFSVFSLIDSKHIANKNGLLIPFINGVLNLKTLKFYPHDYTHYNTNVLSIAYDKNAKIYGTPLAEFLSFICGYNPVKLNLLRACLKAIFTNNISYQIALYIYGPGGTGKSTLINIIIYLLGVEATYSTNLSNLTNRFGLANLNNKILVILNDMSYFKGSEPKILKEIISGDRLEREEKYKKAVSFTPHL